MKRRRQPKMSKADFERFKQVLQPHGDAAPVIYHDALLQRLVVVQHRGEWWLCPRRPGGWSSRQRLTMTTEARQQRLTPARDIDAATLGVLAENRPQDCVRIDADGAT